MIKRITIDGIEYDCTPVAPTKRPARPVRLRDIVRHHGEYGLFEDGLVVDIDVDFVKVFLQETLTGRSARTVWWPPNNVTHVDGTAIDWEASQ